ncbi:MAG TPA: hypothetical protein VFH48_02270 [Chloroflexota bacterium]|nr:hypothetical protein [Chloroflexota bacterium]
MASLVTTRPGFPRLNRLLIVATFLAVLAVAVLTGALLYQFAMAGTTTEAVVKVNDAQNAVEVGQIVIGPGQNPTQTK